MTGTAGRSFEDRARASADERVIVALDLDADEALRIARSLAGVVGWVKVGMTLYFSEGPLIVDRLSELGLRVFVDLKLHDIPYQVGLAARALAERGAAMLTVHASGGAPMVAAAVEGAREGAARAGMPSPHVIAVTVLTSLDPDGLLGIGIERPLSDHVALLARVAASGGADGVVASAHEAALLRSVLGEQALIVTPGIRPAGQAAHDQARVATPAAAIAGGASHIVVGRSVTMSGDPLAAARRIISEIEGVGSWPT